MSTSQRIRLHDRLSRALFDQYRRPEMVVNADDIAEAVVGGMLRSATDGGDPVSYVAEGLGRLDPHFNSRTLAREAITTVKKELRRTI
jgi:hypothetical protein